jgi:hypothetical protein
MAAAGALAVIASGAVIARADGPGARAAQAGGGLSIAPVTIERPVAVGAANVVTIANNGKDALAVTVQARPWTQSSSGAVSPNRRSTLAAMAVSEDSFTLAPGAVKAVTVTLSSAPAGGSLYGALEVVGLPLDLAERQGVALGYRLIGSLRLNPTAAAYSLKAGSAKVTGAGSARALALSVRNAGNTIEPVTGSVRLRGPLGTRNAAVRATRILPGKSVALALASARSLSAGTYTATVTLTQAKQKTTITKRIRVRR